MSFAETQINDQQLRTWREYWRHIQKWKVNFDSATDYESMDRERVDSWPEANAVSSEIVGWPLYKGQHAVLLDIDERCWLYRSSSHEHHHLYIDVNLKWWKYRILLRVLAWCGIIEKGYYKASVRRKASFLRTPDTKKEKL